MTYKDKILSLFLLFTSGCIAISSWGAQLHPFEFKIKAHGVIIVPPCHINNDITVDINFGVVSINSVIVNNNKRTTWIPIDCDDPETPFSVKITGKALENHSNVLETTVSGLGVALIQGGNNIPLNIFFTPEQKNGIQLITSLITTNAFNGEEGEFQANATISTQYE